MLTKIVTLNSKESFIDCQAILKYDIEILDSNVKFTTQLQIKQKSATVGQNVFVRVEPEPQNMRIFSSDIHNNFLNLDTTLVVKKYSDYTLVKENQQQSFYIPREINSKNIQLNIMFVIQDANIYSIEALPFTVPAINTQLINIQPVQNLVRNDLSAISKIVSFSFEDTNNKNQIGFDSYIVEIATNDTNSSFSEISKEISNTENTYIMTIKVQDLLSVLPTNMLNKKGRIRVAIKNIYGKYSDWVYSEPFYFPAEQPDLVANSLVLSLTDKDNPYFYLDFTNGKRNNIQIQYGFKIENGTISYFGPQEKFFNYFENDNISFVYHTLKQEPYFISLLDNFSTDKQIQIRYRSISKDKTLANVWKYRIIHAEDIRKFVQFFIQLENNQSIKGIYLRAE